MSALLDHIQDQQDAAHRLESVLGALMEMNLNQVAPRIQTSLMFTALHMAGEIADALDCVNLPGSADQ